MYSCNVMLKCNIYCFCFYSIFQKQNGRRESVILFLVFCLCIHNKQNSKLATTTIKQTKKKSTQSIKVKKEKLLQLIVLKYFVFSLRGDFFFCLSSRKHE